MVHIFALCLAIVTSTMLAKLEDHKAEQNTCRVGQHGYPVPNSICEIVRTVVSKAMDSSVKTTKRFTKYVIVGNAGTGKNWLVNNIAELATAKKFTLDLQTLCHDESSVTDIDAHIRNVFREASHEESPVIIHLRHAATVLASPEHMSERAWKAHYTLQDLLGHYDVPKDMSPHLTIISTIEDLNELSPHMSQVFCRNGIIQLPTSLTAAQYKAIIQEHLDHQFSDDEWATVCLAAQGLTPEETTNIAKQFLETTEPFEMLTKELNAAQIRRAPFRAIITKIMTEPVTAFYWTVATASGLWCIKKGAQYLHSKWTRNNTQH